MLKRMCDDDPEALRLLREAVKSQGERTDLVDNINEVDRSDGTSKDYTLDRLAREDPSAETNPRSKETGTAGKGET